MIYGLRILALWLDPMQRTLAEHLGSTPHLSPLLHKARRLGFSTSDSLLRLAVRRGCTHYAPPDYDPAQVVDPGEEQISDLELAIALCSAAQQYDPRLVVFVARKASVIRLAGTVSLERRREIQRKVRAFLGLG